MCEMALGAIRHPIYSVIPESAGGGCPESREKMGLDTGSPLRFVRYDDAFDSVGFPKRAGQMVLRNQFSRQESELLQLRLNDKAI